MFTLSFRWGAGLVIERVGAAIETRFAQTRQTWWRSVPKDNEFNVGCGVRVRSSSCSYLKGSVTVLEARRDDQCGPVDDLEHAVDTVSVYVVERHRTCVTQACCRKIISTRHPNKNTVPNHK